MRTLEQLKDEELLELRVLARQLPQGKRSIDHARHGFDVKFAYHTIRLLFEIEQILEEGDLDLRRNSEQLKAIRRGDLTEDEVRKIALDKEHALERLYETSQLRYGPDEGAIKQLLIDCLEEHWGSIQNVMDTALVSEDAPVKALEEIAAIALKFRRTK